MDNVNVILHQPFLASEN